MEVRKLQPFGVAVSPPGGDELRARHDHVAALLHEHALVVVEGARLEPRDQIDLVAAVGPLIDEGMKGEFHGHISHDPAVAAPFAAAGVFRGPLSFHSDLTYTSSPPHVLSLYALELPSTGGETRFANGARALAMLPSDLRAEIEGRSARHVFNAGIDQYGGRYREHELGSRYFAAEHPIVRTNPRTGRDVLFVNELLTDRVLGLDAAASDALLAALFARLYGDDNVYVHRWKLHDLVIWENQEVQHARSDFDRSQRRRLRRVIAGDAQANARHVVEFNAQAQGLTGTGAVLL